MYNTILRLPASALTEAMFKIRVINKARQSKNKEKTKGYGVKLPSLVMDNAIELLFQSHCSKTYNKIQNEPLK